MYNSDRKQRFIDGYYRTLNTRNMIETIFNRIEVFERKLGKDLCAFSMEEIANMVSELTTAKATTASGIISYIRAYAKWCMEQGFPDATLVLRRLKPDLTDAIRRRRVQGPLQLQRFLNACFPPEEAETADLVSRGFAWLAYIGVPGSDITGILVDDVDLSDWYVYIGDNRYQIPAEARNVFQKLATLDSFNYTHSGYGTIRRKRIDNSYLLRTFKGTVNRRVLDNALSDCVNKANEEGKTDLRMNYTDLFRSGLYYRMYQEECVSPPISFQRYASVISQSTRGKQLPSASQRIVMERNLKKDYADWKKVFNL